MKLRVNATVEQATPVLERYAQLGREIGLAEAARDEAIQNANSVADTILVPLNDERLALRAQLEPWFARAGAALLEGKRKTLELGGCIIGTEEARRSLTFADGDDKAALAALQAERWAKPYIRVTFAVDKTGTKKALTGKHGEQLKALGFGLSPAAEVFVLKPVVQDGTIAKTAA